MKTSKKLYHAFTHVLTFPKKQFQFNKDLILKSRSSQYRID